VADVAELLSRNWFIGSFQLCSSSLSYVLTELAAASVATVVPPTGRCQATNLPHSLPPTVPSVPLLRSKAVCKVSHIRKLTTLYNSLRMKLCVIVANQPASGQPSKAYKWTPQYHTRRYCNMHAYNLLSSSGESVYGLLTCNYVNKYEKMTDNGNIKIGSCCRLRSRVCSLFCCSVSAMDRRDYL